MQVQHHYDPHPDIAELHELVAARLSHQKSRYTNVRRELVETLASARQPLTLSGIRAAAPDLASSSIYRNLELLERCGVVHRLSVSGHYSHFELAEPLLSHHHHLVCVACGSVKDIQIDERLDELLSDSLAVQAAGCGFTLLNHNIELHGRCSPCESTESTDSDLRRDSSIC